MKSPMGGWTRLWIFLSVIWFVVVAALTASNLMTMGLRIIESKPLDGGPTIKYYPRLRIVGMGLLVWSVPVAAVYGIGRGVVWVRQGFKQQPTP